MHYKIISIWSFINSLTDSTDLEAIGTKTRRVCNESLLSKYSTRYTPIDRRNVCSVAMRITVRQPGLWPQWGQFSAPVPRDRTRPGSESSGTCSPARPVGSWWTSCDSDAVCASSSAVALLRTVHTYLHVHKVAQKASRKHLSIRSPNIDRVSTFFAGTFCGKFACNKVHGYYKYITTVATLPCKL